MSAKPTKLSPAEARVIERLKKGGPVQASEFTEMGIRNVYATMTHLRRKGFPVESRRGRGHGGFYLTGEQGPPILIQPQQSRSNDGPFEVGVVYRGSDSLLWLAVSGRDVIGFLSGVATARCPRDPQRYARVHTVSVADLCKRWGITEDQLDDATRDHFYPSKTGARARPRGSRQAMLEDRELWRASRIHRGLRLG